MAPLFTLRWAARDLRRRWPQVLAIALVLAIGTGTYAGLGSTATWRRQSNDESFELLRMYDVRVRAAAGADTTTGSLLAVLESLPDPAVVAVAEERLVVPTQVDASTPDQSILVPGRIVGMDLASNGPHVNRPIVTDGRGRTLTGDDDGQPVVLLERNFADFYDLASERTLRLAGGREVTSVGHALAPEYLFVMTEEGGFFAQANFAAVFTSLESAQALAGRPGRVNDLVVRLAPGADLTAALRDVEAAFARSDVGIGATVMQASDEDAYRVLYDDIEGDQRFWNIFAALILLGATVGAFNLATRMVEAQRREIGIGMALGWSRRRLAVRPLLVGAQIALLGVAAGVAVGFFFMWAIRPVFESMLPLPVWRTSMQMGMFARGAALGMVLPIVATGWPVWRAVRVMPVDAITTTHRSGRSGLAVLLRRLRWPIGTFRRMPLGNVLRTPRRTVLTALGIGAAITTLVTTLGMLDSFAATMDRNKTELLGAHPDRVSVSLSGTFSEDGPEIAGVEAADSVGRVEPLLRFGGTLTTRDATAIDVVIEATDLESDLWAPSIESGRLPDDGSGIVIARKAADDLGVEVGEQVVLRHPAVDEAGRFSVVDTRLPVVAIHPSPFRFNAYIDRRGVGAFGMAGMANVLQVLPAEGRTPDDVERDLFGTPGVSSVQPVAVTSRLVEDSLEDFTGMFQVLQAFILFLAVLIAYNATSINADERSRERATLFAFGLPPRRIIWLESVEGLLIGVLGIAVGVAGGLVVVRWIVTGIARTTMPEMGLDVVVSTGTIFSAAMLGVLAVTLAPLLTVRRLRHLDVPGALRIVE